MELSSRERRLEFVGQCPECKSDNVASFVQESLFEDDGHEQWEEWGSHKECFSCFLVWDYVDLSIPFD